MQFQFHEQYRVMPGDNLSKIGKAKGYPNPGPIVFYPPNQSFFGNRSPHLLRPGEAFFIPYPPDLLRKIIATSQHLTGEVSTMATQLMREEQRDKKELEDFLLKIDALNFLANIGVSLGSLSVSAARGTEMTADDIIRWFATEYRPGVVSGITTMAVPAPTAPKKDFSFWVRHSLGPWNPSYWASVYAAIKEGDVDLYLYGADAVTHRNCMKIKRQADQDIARLKSRIAAAQQQLTQPFYQKKL